jgi:hypothetical protein
MTLDENTKIPLFTAIGAVLVLIGGIFWLSSLFAEVTSHTKQIERLQDDQREEMKVLLEIRERVIRLEEKVQR